MGEFDRKKFAREFAREFAKIFFILEAFTLAEEIYPNFKFAGARAFENVVSVRVLVLTVGVALASAVLSYVACIEER